MKIIMNHSMVRVIERDNTYVLSIRMRDGQWAVQQPYPADQRGIIGALTLAVDVLAGKVLLMGIEATPKAHAEENVKLPKQILITDGTGNKV